MAICLPEAVRATRSISANKSEPRAVVETSSLGGFDPKNRVLQSEALAGKHTEFQIIT